MIPEAQAFKLIDKIHNEPERIVIDVISVKDIKEFIRLLKEELDFDDDEMTYIVHEAIDKLSGFSEVKGGVK